MCFKDPYLEKYVLKPYPEVDFSVANNQSFLIKSPWLELRGTFHQTQRQIIAKVENDWHTHPSPVVSDFLSPLSRWPVCFIEDTRQLGEDDSISPIAAFSSLRRQYLITRLETWKTFTSCNFEAKHLLATHYHFIKGSEYILDVADKIYGKFHEPVRVFREQELGHWHLIKSDIDKMGLSEFAPPKNTDRLLSAFDAGTRESFFKFCMFVAICEGSMSGGNGIGHQSYLADAVERAFGPGAASGVKLHNKINHDLAHDSVAFDLISCADPLSRDQFEASRNFIIEIAHLQNENLYELSGLQRS